MVLTSSTGCVPFSLNKLVTKACPAASLALLLGFTGIED